MKYYKLSGVVDHKELSFRKKFTSRNAAIQFMFKTMPDDTQLEYEIVRDSKHNIEYRCNNGNMFFVNRVCKH